MFLFRFGFRRDMETGLAELGDKIDIESADSKKRIMNTEEDLTDMAKKDKVK